MEKSNLLHRPLTHFFYGSISVIALALGLGALYLSQSFISKEKNRANISSVQLSESLGSEHRYIVEEFFTSSYDSVFIRISNALEKFGSPKFNLFLYNSSGDCILSRNQSDSEIPCQNKIEATNGEFLYSTNLKLGNSNLGRMIVLVEDRFQFFTGSAFNFAFKHFLPIFLLVICLLGIWAIISRKFIFVPYYKKMMALEKEKVSTDIIRQIIHDTKGEIAALDLSIYEIEDQQQATEMRRILHNIREAFGNLSHHKEGIVTSVREVPTKALGLFQDFVEQQKIKYKNHSPLVVIDSSINASNFHKIKVDSNSFYRAFSNIVENAVAAQLGQNCCDVRITFSETADSVVISITDNGEGLSDEVQTHLFEKGFTTKENGSGQGLSFVKKVVDGWNGKISYMTKFKRGRGTAFIIEIPSYCKPKVAILDDNTSLLFRYKKILERKGYQAETFEDVSSLMNRSKFLDPDTIFLLDFNLSDNSNGAEVAKRLCDLGMRNIYLHTGNTSLENDDFPYVKGILSKGNFMETMAQIGIS